MSGLSSRVGTAQGSYEYGGTYESLRLQSAQGDPDSTWRTQSAASRAASGAMKKDFTRSFSGTQSVKFAESEILDEEIDEYERSEASSMAGAPAREPVRSAGVLRQSDSRGRVGRDVYSGRSAQGTMEGQVSAHASVHCCIISLLLPRALLSQQALVCLIACLALNQSQEEIARRPSTEEGRRACVCLLKGRNASPAPAPLPPPERPRELPPRTRRLLTRHPLALPASDC
jgi:hypothetical protein